MPGLGSILSLLRLGNVGPVPTDIYGNDPRYKYRTPPFVPEGPDVRGPMDPIIPPIRTIFGSPIVYEPGQEPQAPRPASPTIGLPEPPREQEIAINRMYDLLQEIPKREEYKPSWLRRIFAVPQEYMRPGAAEEFKERPYKRAVEEWKTKFEPVSKAATEERYRNINERQIWAQQYGIQKGQQELAIKQQDADTRRYRQEHPDHELTTDINGNVLWFDPRTNRSGQVYDSFGNPVRQLSKQTEIELGFKGRQAIVEQQNKAAMDRELQRERSQVEIAKMNIEAQRRGREYTALSQQMRDVAEQNFRKELITRQLESAKALSLYREQLDRETEREFPGSRSARGYMDIQREHETRANQFMQIYREAADDAEVDIRNGLPVIGNPNSDSGKAAIEFIYGIKPGARPAPAATPPSAAPPTTTPSATPSQNVPPTAPPTAGPKGMQVPTTGPTAPPITPTRPPPNNDYQNYVYVRRRSDNIPGWMLRTEFEQKKSEFEEVRITKPGQ